MTNYQEKKGNQFITVNGLFYLAIHIKDKNCQRITGFSPNNVFVEKKKIPGKKTIITFQQHIRIRFLFVPSFVRDASFRCPNYQFYGFTKIISIYLYKFPQRNSYAKEMISIYYKVVFLLVFTSFQVQESFLSVLPKVLSIALFDEKHHQSLATYKIKY